MGLEQAQRSSDRRRRESNRPGAGRTHYLRVLCDACPRLLGACEVSQHDDMPKVRWRPRPSGCATRTDVWVPLFGLLKLSCLQVHQERYYALTSGLVSELARGQ